MIRREKKIYFPSSCSLCNFLKIHYMNILILWPKNRENVLLLMRPRISYYLKDFSEIYYFSNFIQSYNKKASIWNFFLTPVYFSKSSSTFLVHEYFFFFFNHYAISQSFSLLRNFSAYPVMLFHSNFLFILYKLQQKKISDSCLVIRRIWK